VKEVVKGAKPGTKVRGRPHTAWQDNSKKWTGISLVELVRATEDRSQWQKVVHDAAKIRNAEKGYGLRVE